MSESRLSESTLYAARPTLRIDGEDPDRIRELLVSLEVSEREAGLSALEARFTNFASLPDGGGELALEDERIVRLGSRIEVYCGDLTAPQEIFRGTVTALEAEYSHHGPPELVVLAEDALQGARMHRRTQVHADVTLRRLAEDLARSLGLTPVITGLSDSIGTHVQLNESDLAFVRRLLRDYDADLQVVGSELHVSPRSDAARGEITLEMYSQLLQVRVLADLAHQRTEVSVAGWDGARGERVTATSRGAQLAPGQGRSGAQILEDALGPRSEHLGQVPVTNAAEAQALADALFDQAARRFVCVQGTAEGNPALRVGSQLRVKGLSPRFDNVYYVVAALHRYDMRRGYETEFEAECAYLGGV